MDRTVASSSRNGVACAGGLAGDEFNRPDMLYRRVAAIVDKSTLFIASSYSRHV
jgi:hypothetical protein